MISDFVYTGLLACTRHESYEYAYILRVEPWDSDNDD